MNRLIERLKAGEEVECYVTDYTDGDGVPDYSYAKKALITRWRFENDTKYPFGGAVRGQVYSYAKPVAEDWRDNLGKGVECYVSDGVDAEGMVDYSQGCTAVISNYNSGFTFPYRSALFGWRYARPKGAMRPNKKSVHADHDASSYQAAIDQHPAFDGGATAKQIGGNHYQNKKHQPINYIIGNELDFCEGSIVKYITRWREKGGVADLEKIKHYCDFLIEEATEDYTEKKLEVGE